MTPYYYFESGLYFDSEKTFHSLAFVISGTECVIALSNDDAVLVYLAVYRKPDTLSGSEFLQKVLLECQALISQDYHQVSIGVQTNFFTLIPDQLDLQGDEIIEFLSGTSSKPRKVLADDIEFLDATMCYSIPEEIFEILEQTFDSFDLQLCTTNGVQIARELRQYDCYLCLDHDEFDLICKRDGQIISVSRNPFESPSDIVYFTLLGLKDAGVDPIKAQVAISGYCLPNSELQESLSEFTQSVQVQLFEGAIRIPNEFDQPKQYYQCVLNLLHAGY